MILLQIPSHLIQFYLFFHYYCYYVGTGKTHSSLSKMPGSMTVPRWPDTFVLKLPTKPEPYRQDPQTMFVRLKPIWQYAPELLSGFAVKSASLNPNAGANTIPSSGSKIVILFWRNCAEYWRTLPLRWAIRKEITSALLRTLMAVLKSKEEP